MFRNTTSSLALNKLTNLGIKSFINDAQAAGTGVRKLSDGGGLRLVVPGCGQPSWSMKYRLGGKEKSYSIGVYPAVTLEEARRQRDQVKAQLSDGKDPVVARRLRRALAVVDDGNTFSNAFEAWLNKMKPGWSEFHYRTSKRAIEKDVLPRLGRLPMSEITPSLMSEVVEGIMRRGVRETASKILQHCSQIFEVARAKGWCKDNPTGPAKTMLPKRKRAVGMPAILEFPGLGDVLRRADAARLSPAVRMAHRLAAFSTARMGNITLAEWSEFDLDLEPAVWTIPRKKMKAQDRPHDHKIILCPPLVDELLEWRNLGGGMGYLFPTPTNSGGNRPISREAVEKAYRATLGLQNKHTPHGWRAAFSTLAKDNGFGRDVVELALDHIHDNDVVRAYDRGERMEERIKLMYWWGERLVEAQRGGELLPSNLKKLA